MTKVYELLELGCHLPDKSLCVSFSKRQQALEAYRAAEY